MFQLDNQPQQWAAPSLNRRTFGNPEAAAAVRRGGGGGGDSISARSGLPSKKKQRVVAAQNRRMRELQKLHFQRMRRRNDFAVPTSDGVVEVVI